MGSSIGKHETGQNQIICLPLELLSKILSHVPHLDRHDARFTCQRFKSAYDSIPKARVPELLDLFLSGKLNEGWRYISNTNHGVRLHPLCTMHESLEYQEFHSQHFQSDPVLCGKYLILLAVWYQLSGVDPDPSVPELQHRIHLTLQQNLEHFAARPNEFPLDSLWFIRYATKDLIAMLIPASCKLESTIWHVRIALNNRNVNIPRELIANLSLEKESKERVSQVLKLYSHKTIAVMLVNRNQVDAYRKRLSSSALESVIEEAVTTKDVSLRFQYNQVILNILDIPIISPQDPPENTEKIWQCGKTPEHRGIDSENTISDTTLPSGSIDELKV